MVRKVNEIRSVSELPEWFDIAKYEAAKKLNYKGWYNNLVARCELLKFAASPIYHKALKAGKKMAMNFDSDLQFVRNTPVFDNQRLWVLNNRRQVNTQLGVQRATLADIYWEKKLFTQDKLDYAEKIITQTYDSEELWDRLQTTKLNKEWEVNPLEEYLSSSVIKVNLNLPEQILIKQFRDMLKEYKHNQPNKIDVVKWSKFGILPYLDLKIWELEFGKSITNRVMADAIYPEGEGGEETVRKTTQKIVNEIINEAQLDKLWSLAANEIGEQINS